ncbi:MAG: M28 family metallopeptidase [Chloroflexota bacterium]
MHHLTARRLTALSLALLTALSLSFGPGALAATTWPAPSSAIVGVRADSAPSFSGSAALQHVNELSVGIGSRVAGSPAQDSTHQYLTTQLQGMGYQTVLQSFPITAYQDRGSKLTLGGALGQSVSANTLVYSAAGAVEAELVEAGLGRPEDYEDANASGKIALVTRGDIRFADKVDAAAKAGVLAVIIANNVPGSFNGSLIGMSAIPAVGVSQEDGAVLRQAIRAGGATIRVEVNATSAQSTGANVVATRAGGPKTLVIGAHIDSVAAGPGANDNASGTATALELARVLASRPTPYTVQVVGFDAEEVGLVGSSYFVSQLSDAEKQAIIAMLNFDMVGVGTESRAGGTDSLVRLAQAAGAQEGVSVGQLGDGLGGASDHASFMRAGIPALFVYRSNDPNYHSPNDRFEYVDAANLQIAGNLALDVIAALERGE